jgi:hypothetical protein
MEGIEVKYCPTGVMLADFFTKPLQGSLFRKFWDIVMGYKHIDSLNQVDEESPLEERVGRNVHGEDFISSGNYPSSEKKKKVTWADSVRKEQV